MWPAVDEFTVPHVPEYPEQQAETINGCVPGTWEKRRLPAIQLVQAQHKGILDTANFFAVKNSKPFSRGPRGTDLGVTPTVGWKWPYDFPHEM